MIRVPLVWLSVAVAVLAGCSSDTPPSALPLVSPAPVASPSPSPSPSMGPRDLPLVPGPPAVARTRTPEGAAAFARYFYEQIRPAHEARDPSVLAVMSAPGCLACARYIASVTRARDRDERVVILLKVVASVSPAIGQNRVVQVDVVYDFGGSKAYDASGTFIGAEAAQAKRQSRATLSWLGDRWSILSLAAR